MNTWEQAQQWESEWWGNASNSLYEELKQLTYASKMGLVRNPSAKTPYRFDLGGKSVLDIGGGPESLLLKCVNFKGKVVDPMKQPKWVLERYKEAGIEYEQKKAEEIKEKAWDEVWIYNVLQHCEDPKKVIDNAKKAGKLVRVFDWINTPKSPGHINNLTETQLDEYFGGVGKSEHLTEPPTIGWAYYGIFL